jgi:hypothetical protein
MTLESAGFVANAEPKTGWPPNPGPWLQHDPDHIQVASELCVSSSLSNTRIPDPDGSVAALEPIAGSQVWQAGGTAVRVGLQDAINKAGPITARAVSRAASVVFFLLGQAGRTGLGGRHSTTRVTVVSAASLPAHDLAPDIADHASSSLEQAVVARSKIRDKAGGPGRVLGCLVLAHYFNCSPNRSMRGLQAGLFRPSPGVHLPDAIRGQEI